MARTASASGTRSRRWRGSRRDTSRKQLRAWQQGTRGPGPLGLMKSVATRLTSPEVDAVAQYFGGPTQTDVDPKAKP